MTRTIRSIMQISSMAFFSVDDVPNFIKRCSPVHIEVPPGPRSVLSLSLLDLPKSTQVYGISRLSDTGMINLTSSHNPQDEQGIQLQSRAMDRKRYRKTMSSR